MRQRKYPSDLSNKEWGLIEDLFTTDRSKGGRPAIHPRRDIVDAVFYVLKTGCQWRYLPGDFPNWKTVYLQYRRWLLSGLFEQLYNRLRKLERKRQGREEEPTAGIVDSQSVKTGEKGGSEDLMEVKK